MRPVASESCCRDGLHPQAEPKEVCHFLSCFLGYFVTARKVKNTEDSYKEVESLLTMWPCGLYALNIVFRKNLQLWARKDLACFRRSVMDQSDGSLDDQNAERETWAIEAQIVRFHRGTRTLES